ncbi:MAG: hypothetical protein GY862_25950 [Gammaproteobacteria bacterium]|nr:hypothetical protein [Gammaproteobacteria bacterium]
MFENQDVFGILNTGICGIPARGLAAQQKSRDLPFFQDAGQNPVPAVFWIQYFFVFSHCL